MHKLLLGIFGSETTISVFSLKQVKGKIFCLRFTMPVKSYSQQHFGRLPVLMSHILHSQLLSKRGEEKKEQLCFPKQANSSIRPQGTCFWTVVMSLDADMILALLDHVFVYNEMSFDSSRL